jgi:hypothetical protein
MHRRQGIGQLFGVVPSGITVSPSSFECPLLGRADNGPFRFSPPLTDKAAARGRLQPSAVVHAVQECAIAAQVD